jgi:hypothetical protein
MPLHSRTVRRIQGVYYVATGLWPVVATDHYMDATGQTSHAWAARTLGAAVAGLGLALAADVIPDRHARRASIGAAVLLAAGAAYFVARGKGLLVNGGDGAVQVGFALAALLGRDRR